MALKYFYGYCRFDPVDGFEIYNGEEWISLPDASGFVRTDNPTMQTGYFNIQSGYLDSLYFPTNGVVNANVQLNVVAGDNMNITAGVGDINIQPAGDVVLKNIVTTQPTVNGPGTVLMGKLRIGSDMNYYWEVDVDGVTFYIPTITSLP